VTLARTFVPRPHVLLLDEPLAGLDPAGRIQLRGVLGMLRDQGCAMIVSSHILSDLEEVATHIAIIEEGAIKSWSEAETFRHQDIKRRTYRIDLVDPSDGFVDLLGGVEGVTNPKANDHGFLFDYHADERQAAALLSRLIGQGMAVSFFAPVRTSLEDAYLKSGVKQVD